MKNHKLDAVMSKLNDTPALQRLVSSDEEAYVTLSWLQRLYNTSRDVYGDDPNGMTAACLSIRSSCCLSLLQFSLELLAQRIYLMSFGPGGDPANPILKGGGVNACTIKRVTW